MDDFVNTLRGFTPAKASANPAYTVSLMKVAADEIERLQGRLFKLEDDLRHEGIERDLLT